MKAMSFWRGLTLVLILVGVAAAFIFVIGTLPSVVVELDVGRQITALEARELAEAKNNARGVLLQALVGLGLAATALVGWRNLRISREGQITERFTRAIEQLGNTESRDVRVGGIYALERIARDSRADHAPVMEVLTAFLREHAFIPKSILEWEPSQPPHDPRLPSDVDAAVRVIGRRRTRFDSVDVRLDLRSTNLKDAVLPDSNFARADLLWAHIDRADLEGADLRDSSLVNAHMNRANLRGANLEGAVLAGARLQHANLKNARLRDADLEFADLQNANLEGTDFRGSNLDCAGFEGANLKGADLGGVSLVGARDDSRTIWPDGFSREQAGVINRPLDRKKNQSDHHGRFKLKSGLRRLLTRRR